MEYIWNEKGFSFDFWSILIARIVSGIGEASFIGLAPTYIDDIAPEKRRSIWLAIFFAMIPIGAATGYGFSGICTEYFSWRFTFVVETLVMTPIAISCWFVPYSEEVLYQVGRKPKAKDIPLDQEQISFYQSLKMLFSNLRFDFLVLGYSAVVVSNIIMIYRVFLFNYFSVCCGCIIFLGTRICY